MCVCLCVCVCLSERVSDHLVSYFGILEHE